jgi:type IV pilus assembly protein PilA
MSKTQAQSGFTTVEILITVAIISIFATLAVTTYADYSQRARVSGGVRLVAPVKLAVSEYFSSHGKLPDSNAAAGVAAPEEISDRDIRSVTIGLMPTTGTIIVAYKARGSIADGDSVLLVPLKYHDTVLWQCTSKTLMNKLLPAACSK